MKRVVVLGSTGSIGTQTLDVVAQHPDKLKVVGLLANTSGEDLRLQALRTGCHHCALMDEEAGRLHGIPAGLRAAEELATLPEADLVVVAVAGVVGLLPTLAAIRAGKDIALASKEVLVAAGEVVMREVAAHKVMVTPIDSEHSAVFQCLQGYPTDQVEQLVLTASGGPFRGWDRDRLAGVTVEQALAHPTWKMGGKITVDSATLMNKALETIEAKWLFGLEMDKVEAVVHPQSIVHSFVRFCDSSVLAQLGWPDMRLPIQYALLHPERVPGGLRRLDPVETPNLTFEPVDHEAFPALGIARDAVAKGGTTPCAFNGANEEVVKWFLQGRCGFLQVSEVVRQVVDSHRPYGPTIEDLLEADRWARETVRREIAIQ